MERTQDIRKKYPLLVVGNQPFPGLEGELLSRIEGAEWQHCFVCLTGTSEDLRERLHEAHTLRIPREQILILTRELPLSFQPPAGTIIFAFHSEECPEDFRYRLCQKLESLRHEKLQLELERLEKLGLFEALTSAHAIAAVDHARFAHALACLYGLNPQRHSLAIRLAASVGQPEVHARLFPESEYPFAESVWNASLPPEQLLALSAALAAAHGTAPATFRDHFRASSALLPFRIRNELKGHLEKILEPLWGGKHVA